MKTTHTPPPWKVCKDAEGGAKVVCFDLFGSSAMICGRNKEDNARLIAAAPDLLAACKAAQHALGLSLCGTPSPSYFEQVKADRITRHNLTIEDGLAENSRQIKTDSAAALALIKAAIARAEGEAS